MGLVSSSLTIHSNMKLLVVLSLAACSYAAPVADADAQVLAYGHGLLGGVYHAGVAPAATVAVAPVAYQVGYQVHHQVHHVPQVTVQKHTSTHATHHVINHAPVVGAFIGAVPVVAAAEAAPAEAEAAAVEEA